ncbi:MAG: hypothetical protein A2Y14_04635 [Verrucomicrobia bacterium GWF2_51_19]|nr:MAG: hypothetical protein A2Y14_04635 [Verrucomicrobia bacterium GWF2_51_19]HCJ12307.1 haloacid dehalogenase-like hydrolase [Opitutae bacterium]
MAETFRSSIVACVWDFDKTLIPGYMQEPLFQAYSVDEETFWRAVNAMPERYAQRGLSVSTDTIYLNHLLTYVRHGIFKGLNNKRLHAFGKELLFYPGLPNFFKTLKTDIEQRYAEAGIKLEHYIISTGLAEIIRGSAIAPHVDGIFACELIESPLPPHFEDQCEIEFNEDAEVSQIGRAVDNTMKTRFIYEINKGCNKNRSIHVNAPMRDENRRVPIKNMIYIADGPSDIPAFSVIRNEGGKAFAVYDEDNPKAFEQCDDLLQSKRIHAYGPADYRTQSKTALWLQLHLTRICEDIVEEHHRTLSKSVGSVPQHLHSPKSGAHHEQGYLFPAP